jgi:hypothetical protein
LDACIFDGYTLEQALDSGTVSYDYEDQEIRLAPILLQIFNMDNQLLDPCVLKFVTKRGRWTWKDVGKAHLLYLAATMMALQKEKLRFVKNDVIEFSLPCSTAEQRSSSVLPCFPFWRDIQWQGLRI